MVPASSTVENSSGKLTAHSISTEASVIRYESFFEEHFPYFNTVEF
jgi:hypothetical protein